MSRYDEDRVIALLRDAVPPLPDPVDRVPAVKHRAGRQRAALWTQTLGATASVLVVVGVAAAVAGPSGPRRIDPADEPLKALVNALTNERSVRFEATMRLVGDPEQVVDGSGPTAEQIARAMDSRVTGAATRDGDFQVAGDASFVTTWGFGYGGAPDIGAGDADPMAYDVDFRVVDGVSYRRALPSDGLPPGKSWISESAGERQDVEDLQRALNVLSVAADDVEYVREVEIGGEPVAEYQLVVPTEVTDSIPVKVRFALDAQNRLRRVTSQFSWTGVTLGGFDGSHEQGSQFGGSGSGWTEYGSADEDGPIGMDDANPLVVRVQVDLFGYGEDVRITAPPAGEVVPAAVLYGQHGYGALEACLDAAKADSAAVQDCYEKEHSVTASAAPTPSCVKQSDGSEMCSFSSNARPGFGGSPGYGSVPPAPPATTSRGYPATPATASPSP